MVSSHLSYRGHKQGFSLFKEVFQPTKNQHKPQSPPVRYEGMKAAAEEDVPGLPVRAETPAAAIAPPTGGAGVVRRVAADAAEVSGGQRGGRGRR